MRFLGMYLLLLTALVSLACSGTMAVTYSPGITKRGTGPIRVDPFRYEPHHAAAGRVESNQIQNTAIGSLYITQDVSELIREAVKKELHFMGYEYSQSSFRAIRGNVKKFKADDLGFSVDWSLEVGFDVVTAEGTIFTGSCRAVTSTSKGPGFVQGATSEIIRSCIDQFVTAAQAQKAL